MRANSGDNLLRKRREWILPPKLLKENVDYSGQLFIAKIRSDFEANETIRYSLEGIGANQKPFDLFVVNPENGFIRLTQKLDREKIDTYNLSGVATNNKGQVVERNIAIRIKVVDENDNDPEFGVIKSGKVDEHSSAGTSVMKITATDADEPGLENSQIAYSIIAQDPSDDMFYMTDDGTIYVNRPFLDRETVDHYTLSVKGQDLNGKQGGRSGTGTVTINVVDVNDNLPTLEKVEYEGSINENEHGVEVMRIKAEDLDQEGTDNWKAVFEIIKGNEAGYFSIRTDPNTNEGILMLDKAVNYEDVKDLDLGLIVRNNASFFDGSAGNAGVGSSWQSGTKYKTYPIKINVKNQPEGPSFDPKVKSIPISEGGHSININDVIAHYPAIDGDTREPAENVRSVYAKGSDPDNWLTIDPKTAEIKLNKMPDRESPFLVNGTYIAQVLCITEDMPSTTATGTVAIQVQDLNDHCPIVTSNMQTMCTTDYAVIVNAQDEDTYPNGPPFDFFIVPEGTKGKWKVEHLNDTAAILRVQESLWPGFYEVELVIRDEQGEACPEPQKVKVRVCTCEDGVVCGKKGGNADPSKGAELGPAGIGLLFLGLLLLAFILLLLLFCQCGQAAGLSGGFAEMPFDTKSHLINYRTEGPGVNTVRPTDVSILRVSTEFFFLLIFFLGESITPLIKSQIVYDFYHGNDFLLTFEQKLTHGNENLEVKDSLLVYDYEGQGSSAGSVGCCSLLESDNDTQFLDDLGPKFKTLAKVCRGKPIPTEIKQVFTPLPNASINTQSSVSGLVSTPQLPPPTQLQSTVSNMQETVVRDTSERYNMVKERMATEKGEMVNQGQMLLLQQQQPVYYATKPVLQPMHYIIQPQVQNTMLLAESAATNLQGMVLINGTQTGPAPGMVVQGQAVMSSGQYQGPSMVLVQKSGLQGGNSNLIHTGNLADSQTLMVVEDKVPAGKMKVLKGSQTCLVQRGTLQPRGSSGSQRVLVIGEPTSSEGQVVQEAVGLSKKFDSQGFLYSTSTGSQGSVVGSFTTMGSSTPTYRNVVMQEPREIH
uniref:Cadherin domain-containing protein n=1 Tax=Scophthalmus maximus TaxID=52904 RepID=A0A8D3BMF8_SCOMX